VDDTYSDRAKDVQNTSGHIIVAGANYGQGSSREHAVIAPRYLGLRAVLAISYARIHWQNLANFGVLALEFADASDYDRVDQGDELELHGIRSALQNGAELTVRNVTKDEEYGAIHRLSERQVGMLLAGGLIPWLQR
jgi:aconitate hydratase